MMILSFSHSLFAIPHLHFQTRLPPSQAHSWPYNHHREEKEEKSAKKHFHRWEGKISSVSFHFLFIFNQPREPNTWAYQPQISRYKNEEGERREKHKNWPQSHTHKPPSVVESTSSRSALSEEKYHKLNFHGLFSSGRYGSLSSKSIKPPFILYEIVLFCLLHGVVVHREEKEQQAKKSQNIYSIWFDVIDNAAYSSDVETKVCLVFSGVATGSSSGSSFHFLFELSSAPWEG